MNGKDLEILMNLVNSELIQANKKFPQFQSRHESYAVMKEEIEEAKEEILNLWDYYLEYNFWTATREDKERSEVKPILESMESTAIAAIQELIQVVAMIQKAMRLESYQEQVFKNEQVEEQL